MGTFPQYEYPHTLEKYARAARYLGINGSSDRECVDLLIDKIEQLKETVGCKKTLADYGVSEKDFLATLDSMSRDAFDDQCTGANPRYPLIKELKQIYMNVYYGKTFTEIEKPTAEQLETLGGTKDVIKQEFNRARRIKEGLK